MPIKKFQYRIKYIEMSYNLHTNAYKRSIIMILSKHLHKQPLAYKRLCNLQRNIYVKKKTNRARGESASDIGVNQCDTIYKRRAINI